MAQQLQAAAACQALAYSPLAATKIVLAATFRPGVSCTAGALASTPACRSRCPAGHCCGTPARREHIPLDRRAMSRRALPTPSHNSATCSHFRAEGVSCSGDGAPASTSWTAESCLEARSPLPATPALLAAIYGSSVCVTAGACYPPPACHSCCRAGQRWDTRGSDDGSSHIRLDHRARTTLLGEHSGTRGCRMRCAMLNLGAAALQTLGNSDNPAPRAGWHRHERKRYNGRLAGRGCLDMGCQTAAHSSAEAPTSCGSSHSQQHASCTERNTSVQPASNLRCCCARKRALGCMPLQDSHPCRGMPPGHPPDCTAAPPELRGWSGRKAKLVQMLGSRAASS